jgi:hypothetical protein
MGGDGSSGPPDRVALKLLRPDGTEMASIEIRCLVPTTAPPPDLPARYGLNLFLAALIGVLTCAWLAIFTEDLPLVAATLGLGGSLVWIAFIANLVGEERRKGLQKAFDDHVMLKPRTTGILVVAGMIGVWLALSRGNVLFISKDDVTARAVTVERILDETGTRRERIADDLLLGNSKLRLPLGASPSGQRYLIRVTGLPAIERRVYPLTSTVVRSPASFTTRPVVLVRIDSGWAKTASDAKNWVISVALIRDERKIADETVRSYDGKSLWIGCDTTVPLPDAVKERWRDDLKGNDMPVVWTQMRSALPNVVLRQGDVVELTLFNSNEHPMKPRQKILVRAGGYDADRIQEVHL